MRLTARELIGIAIFLLAWTGIETATGTGHASRSAPGTTYEAAARVGATVTLSKQPSALEDQSVKPAPAPRE
jgi:hypothetical protein